MLGVCGLQEKGDQGRSSGRGAEPWVQAWAGRAENQEWQSWCSGDSSVGTWQHREGWRLASGREKKKCN